ncbi:MAG: site-2 protease family protein [Cyanothece sp. SIO1E1]|nr:site-2 protease family protein [Cyanothece sp. SIO1E1]
MNGNLRCGSVFGIPIYLNLSWFLVLALMTWTYGGGLAVQFPGLGAFLPWALGLATAILLFASVLAHELGHSFVALGQGIQVRSITLFLFGGIASIEKEPSTPAGAFWVAIAGPLVSFMLCGIFIALGFLTPILSPAASIIKVLAYINLALGVFNLIPGLPLDGGNVLKALVWKITGKPYQGTVVASRMGQLFGWAAIAFGTLSVLGISNFGSFWTVLIGWFLVQNAGRSGQSAKLQAQLSNLTAADAVIPKSPIVVASSSLREFANNCIIGNDVKWHKFLVTDDTGKLMGEVAVSALKTIATSEWWNIKVQALMQPIEPMLTVQSDQSLLDVVTLLERENLSALPVIDNNQVLLGLLEKASIRRLIVNSRPNSI